MKLSHDEAVQVCYLRTAEFVKAAAAEDGIDADAVANDMSDEELAEVLDEVVEALASEGAFDDVLESVEEEAPAEEAETVADETETAEAASGIVEKTAALLEMFAMEKEAGAKADAFKAKMKGFGTSVAGAAKAGGKYAAGHKAVVGGAAAGTAAAGAGLTMYLKSRKNKGK